MPTVLWLTCIETIHYTGLTIIQQLSRYPWLRIVMLHLIHSTKECSLLCSVEQTLSVQIKVARKVSHIT
jgi:hypothetical protein